MFIALRADVLIFFNILFPDNLPALVTLNPQTFRADFLLARSVQLTGLPLKPCHKTSRWSLVVSRWLAAAGLPGDQRLVFNSPLRHHALLVRVFDLAHFSYRVGKLDN